MKELGAGNGGTVSKVMHAATKVVMAKKVTKIPLYTQVIHTHSVLDYTCGSEERSPEADCP